MYDIPKTTQVEYMVQRKWWKWRFKTTWVHGAKTKSDPKCFGTRFEFSYH